MNDAYIDAFRRVVQETQEETGFELPEHFEAYISMLLANYIDKSNFLPVPGFYQKYLTLKEQPKQNSKELGDVCLFVSGVFPAYGSRYGIDKKYYTQIGISSYEMAGRMLHYEMFFQLAKHFEVLREFIELATNSQKFDSKLFKTGRVSY